MAVGRTTDRRNRCDDGLVEQHIWRGGVVSTPPCQTSPPLVQHGEKPQNRPLSNLNTGALLHALLPVITLGH